MLNIASQFTLIDDGTLDTVFQCQRCKREERFTQQPDEDFVPEELDDGGQLSSDEARVKFFLDLAVDEHECPQRRFESMTPDGSFVYLHTRSIYDNEPNTRFISQGRGGVWYTGDLFYDDRGEPQVKWEIRKEKS